MSQHQPSCATPIKRLENSRVVLEHFNIALHAEPFVQGTKDHPNLFDYVNYGPFSTVQKFSAFYNNIASHENEHLFAIFARRDADDKEGEFAGIIAFDGGSIRDATTEIGMITILPPFQRTFVTSNAIGLMLQYALDSSLMGGCGLRRCEWKAHTGNTASQRVAARMGFEYEGILRFHRIVPIGKPDNGYDPSQSSVSTHGRSRDSAIYAHYCDTWPEKRKQVVAVMERRS